MKRIIKTVKIILVSLVFISCGGGSEVNKEAESTQNAVEHQWTENEVSNFMDHCNVIAVEFAGDKAEEYCNCVRDLILSERPDPEVAHEMADHEWMELLENSECHEKFNIPMIENKWTEEVTESFLVGCMEPAIARYGDEEKATSFCNCALEKTKVAIPNPHYAIMMTEEELNEIAQSCE